MIQSFSFGRMTIAGETYTSDIILYPDRVSPVWWRKSGHTLCLDDLREIPFDKFDVFIVGTGAFGVMKVKEEVKEFLKSKGVEMITAKTKNAVHKYNEISRLKRTVAAFHLTC